MTPREPTPTGMWSNSCCASVSRCSLDIFFKRFALNNRTPQLISKPTPPGETTASGSSQSNAATPPIVNPYPNASACPYYNQRYPAARPRSRSVLWLGGTLHVAAAHCCLSSSNTRSSSARVGVKRPSTRVAHFSKKNDPRPALRATMHDDEAYRRDAAFYAHVGNKSRLDRPGRRVMRLRNFISSS